MRYFPELIPCCKFISGPTFFEIIADLKKKIEKLKSNARCQTSKNLEPPPDCKDSFYFVSAEVCDQNVMHGVVLPEDR